MVELNYEDAEYDDGMSGLDRDLVFKTLFVDDEAGFHRSISSELSVLEELGIPDSLTVTEVRVDVVEDDLVDFYVRIPELTVGTQTSRGKHSRMVLRDDSFAHYQVAIEN